ncbi:hypothetical protein AB1Y20_019581 [Prymnesium parvum]|uniref:Uncharacterized protein n=1 Tax=Prymnesium parvum TaxID=97485 RepID=A0AB34JUR3_PRYPA
MNDNSPKEKRKERREAFDKLVKAQPPLAGQRRSRAEDNSEHPPPDKQGRAEGDEEGDDPQKEEMELEQDIDKVRHPTALEIKACSTFDPVWIISLDPVWILEKWKRAYAPIYQNETQLYLVDDQRAYEKERETEKGKRFFIQKKMVNTEFAQAKKRQEDKSSDFYKLILRANEYKHTFTIENIALQVLNILQDMEIDLEINDISVSAFGVKGPYVVALRSQLGASSLQEEGIVLTDLQSNPPVKQFFDIAPYNASTNEVKASSTSEDIAMSIFYKLGNEYTGLRLDKNQLEEPKSRILKEITQVFGEASDILQYVIIQPRTECGIIRNDLRVIIKYNKVNEAKVEPEVGEQHMEYRHAASGKNVK